jgi:hypothetical protein
MMNGKGVQKQGKVRRVKNNSADAIALVNQFTRTQAVVKTKGCQLMSKTTFIAFEVSRDFEDTEKERVIRAKKKWKKRINDPAEHTEYEDEELCLAVKASTNIGNESRLQLELEKGDATKANLRTQGAKGLTNELPSMFANQGGRILVKAAASTERRVQKGLAGTASIAIKDDDDAEDDDDAAEDEEGEEEETPPGSDDDEDDPEPKPRKRVVGKGIIRSIMFILKFVKLLLLFI